MKTIVGLFDTNQEAASTVADLERDGYARDQISIVAGQPAGEGTAGDPTLSGTATRDHDVAHGAGTGAVIGGVTGGAAGLIASLAGLAVPGIGPVLAAGPLIATLTGAGVGAVAGGLVGALTAAGVPDEHARYYAEGVRRGGTLVTVTAEDDEAERVMEIMNRHHPVDIEDRAAAWGQTSFAGSGPGVAPPAYRPATTADFNQAFKGGTIELTERAEEVVVDKEASERTETMRDTVRRTGVDVQPVELGSGATAAGADFEKLEADFRTDFRASHRGSDYEFDKARPAYRYGCELASGRGQSAGEWTSVEPDARRRWEERNPGTWDKVKDAAKYAYDRARSKVS